MNPIERAIRRVDATQRRYTATAFVFGVVKKYGDDNGGVLVSNLAYSAFVAMFPLLLVLTTILGYIVSVDPSFRADALNAVASQVPLIGRTLTENVHQLKRSSVIGLVVGLLGLIWGSTGLAQSGLFTMGQVWNLPGPARPGYVQRLGRAMLFLCLLGGGVIVTTLLASLNTYGHKAFVFVVLAEVAAAAVNVGMYIGAFRVLTPKGVPTGSLLPGAITGGILWTVLQVLGTWLDSPLPAQRLGVRRVRHRARPDRLDLPGGGDHRVLRGDQRGAGPAAVAAVHRAAAAHRGRPGQHGAAGAAEPAAPGGARRGDLHDRPPGAAEPASTPQTPEQVTPPATVGAAGPQDPPDPGSAGDRA